MELVLGSTRLRFVRADITTLSVDAIVNAANPTLLGGGGVDGAIHRAAGPELLAACRALPEASLGVRCPTGEVRSTPAGRLPARYVLHTVGPIHHHLGPERSQERLACCYRSCLEEAARLGCRSVAFSSISTGVYGYPIREAAPVALGTVARFVHEHPAALDEVVFALFSEGDLRVYEGAASDVM
jgi:O-acetyl-ADP-ribose deacetylase (regulator of RNase III)